MIAVVSGASRGIGEAIAKVLASSHEVIGTSTSGGGDLVALDLADKSSIKATAEAISKRAKPSGIDVLVNNAGYLGSRSSLTEDVEDGLRVMQVNILGLMAFTAALLPTMNDGSVIFNISSGAGDIESIASYNLGAYNVSKAAVDMYSRALADKLQARGIKVISVDPGWVATDMGGSAAPKQPSEVADEIRRMAEARNQLRSGHKYYQAKAIN